jgi:hypothetical protein
MSDADLAEGCHLTLGVGPGSVLDKTRAASGVELQHVVLIAGTHSV